MHLHVYDNGEILWLREFLPVIYALFPVRPSVLFLCFHPLLCEDFLMFV